MKQLMTGLLVSALLLVGGVPWAMAEGKIQLRQSDGSVTPLGGVDDAAKVTKTTLDACERVIEGVCVVEERYSTIPIGGTTAMIAADQLYKSGPGYVRGISCSSDATATAGTITLRDNTAAGAGNILWEQDILAIAYTPGMIKEDLQTPFSVGLYLDFTTTADVKCMVRWR